MAKTTYRLEELEQQLSESRREFTAASATIHNLDRQLAEVVSVPDERAAFETFMEKRFKDCIDRLMVKNGGGEYFAWDMQVAWIVWQGYAAMLQAGNSPVTPDGWQLVPKEPTEAMNKAGWAAINEHDAINPTYRAMLAAAPKQEVK